MSGWEGDLPGRQTEPNRSPSLDKQVALWYHFVALVGYLPTTHFYRSPLAQWQSVRLLTEMLMVRVHRGEFCSPAFEATEFLCGLLHVYPLLSLCVLFNAQ